MNKIHSHRNELAASQAFCMILPKALIGFREIFFLFLVADLSFFQALCQGTPMKWQVIYAS